MFAVGCVTFTKLCANSLETVTMSCPVLVADRMAAAIAYGMDKKKGERTILVLNLGAGMCDVTLLNIDNKLFEVLSSAGNSNLGRTHTDRIYFVFI